MKTTVELPDDLFLRAKEIALSRRVSFKELLTHAIKREIGSTESEAQDDFEVDDLGIPLMKRRRKQVTSEFVAKLLEEE